MYKNQSSNMQSRSRRGVLDGTRSEVDMTAFAGPLEKERSGLVVEKKLIEADLLELGAKIREAKARVWTGRGYAPPNQFAKWQSQRANLARRTATIDARLREINDAFKSAQPKTISFEEAFSWAAKDILADDVYRRIEVLAVHRMCESAE